MADPTNNNINNNSNNMAMEVDQEEGIIDLDQLVDEEVMNSINKELRDQAEGTVGDMYKSSKALEDQAVELALRRSLDQKKPAGLGQGDFDANDRAVGSGQNPNVNDDMIATQKEALEATATAHSKATGVPASQSAVNSQNVNNNTISTNSINEASNAINNTTATATTAATLENQPKDQTTPADIMDLDDPFGEEAMMQDASHVFRLNSAQTRRPRFASDQTMSSYNGSVDPNGTVSPLDPGTRNLNDTNTQKDMQRINNAGVNLPPPISEADSDARPFDPEEIIALTKILKEGQSGSNIFKTEQWINTLLQQIKNKELNYESDTDYKTEILSNPAMLKSIPLITMYIWTSDNQNKKNPEYRLIAYLSSLSTHFAAIVSMTLDHSSRFKSSVDPRLLEQLSATIKIIPTNFDVSDVQLREMLTIIGGKVFKDWGNNRATSWRNFGWKSLIQNWNDMRTNAEQHTYRLRKIVNNVSEVQIRLGVAAEVQGQQSQQQQQCVNAKTSSLVQASANNVATPKPAAVATSVCNKNTDDQVTTESNKVGSAGNIDGDNTTTESNAGNEGIKNENMAVASSRSGIKQSPNSPATGPPSVKQGSLEPHQIQSLLEQLARAEIERMKAQEGGERINNLMESLTRVLQIQTRLNAVEPKAAAAPETVTIQSHEVPAPKSSPKAAENLKRPHSGPDPTISEVDSDNDEMVKETKCKRPVNASNNLGSTCRQVTQHLGRADEPAEDATVAARGNSDALPTGTAASNQGQAEQQVGKAVAHGGRVPPPVRTSTPVASPKSVGVRFSEETRNNTMENSRSSFRLTTPKKAAQKATPPLTQTDLFEEEGLNQQHQQVQQQQDQQGQVQQTVNGNNSNGETQTSTENGDNNNYYGGNGGYGDYDSWWTGQGSTQLSRSGSGQNRRGEGGTDYYLQQLRKPDVRNATMADFSLSQSDRVEDLIPGGTIPLVDMEDMSIIDSGWSKSLNHIIFRVHMLRLIVGLHSEDGGERLSIGSNKTFTQSLAEYYEEVPFVYTQIQTLRRKYMESRSNDAAEAFHLLASPNTVELGQQEINQLWQRIIPNEADIIHYLQAICTLVMNGRNPYNYNVKELVFTPNATNVKVKLAMITKLTPPSDLVLLCQNYSADLESTLTNLRRLLKSAKQLSTLTSEDISEGLSEELVKKVQDMAPQDLILVSYSIVNKMAPANMVGYRALLGKKATVIQELTKKDYAALVKLIITKVVNSSSQNFSGFLEGLMLSATMIEDWQPARKRKADDWTSSNPNSNGNQNQGNYTGGGQGFGGGGWGNKKRRMGTGYIYGYANNYGVPQGFQMEGYGVGGPSYMGNNGGGWHRAYDRWVDHWNNTNQQQGGQRQQQQQQQQQGQAQQQQNWNGGGGQSQQNQQHQGRKPTIAQRLVKAYANLATYVDSLDDQAKEAYLQKFSKLQKGQSRDGKLRLTLDTETCSFWYLLASCPFGQACKRYHEKDWTGCIPCDARQPGVG